jgi:uncharacterized metal-binding protein YceD (DUF177 family)
MRKNNSNNKIEYIIEYASLPVGEHDFEFDIDNLFIQQYHTEPLENNFNFKALIKIIKYNHSIQVKVILKGEVSVICDKCLIPYQYPIEYEATLLVEKGNPDNSTDEILLVEENDNKINFSQYLYETISLSIPFKIVPCEDFEGVKCDYEILDKINKNLQETNKSTTFADLLSNKFKK